MWLGSLHGKVCNSRPSMKKIIMTAPMPKKRMTNDIAWLYCACLHYEGYSDWTVYKNGQNCDKFIEFHPKNQKIKMPFWTYDDDFDKGTMYIRPQRIVYE